MSATSAPATSPIAVRLPAALMAKLEALAQVTIV
jgi:hypothetical protein